MSKITYRNQVFCTEIPGRGVQEESKGLPEGGFRKLTLLQSWTPGFQVLDGPGHRWSPPLACLAISDDDVPSP